MKYYFNKLGIFLAAIAIVFVGFVFIWFKYLDIFKTGNGPGSEVVDTMSGTPAQQVMVNLLVDFGNGRVISYTAVELNPNDTAYSLLIKKMTETNSEVRAKKYDYGIMVDSIDNIAASNTFFWSYLVNGQTGSVAADKYLLKDGDRVEWKYLPIQK